MAKTKTAFFCKECGYESSKWLGRCPGCGAWNTMVEEKVATGAPSGGAPSRDRSLLGSIGASGKPVALTGISTNSDERISLSISEVDKILGGGLVKGSLTLLAGEPGIGKSTLSLQIPLVNPELKTLYVSGEESAAQIKLRSERLGGDPSSCLVYSETVVENIIEQIRAVEPDLVVVDSVQTMYSEALESGAGSVSQIREVAASLLKVAKSLNVPIILIGHITKDGTIAGPKVLEHIVDVVLQFEGENNGSYRLLRSVKNRFGATGELAVFEMRSNGLRQILNPSELLTPVHTESLSGVAVAAMEQGSRPLMIEIQALVSSAAYGTAQRSATGFDTRRLNMLLAVLEKRAGFHLAAKDVFINMAGGMKVSDPGCDLAVVAAVLSSTFDVALPGFVAFAGEVGLSGEIRPVGNVEKRIVEAERLGFKKIFISSYCKLDRKFDGIQVVRLADVPALVLALFR